MPAPVDPQPTEHEASPIELCVNGERRRIRVDPTTPLLYVLRNDLGLRAAKYGCGREQCGACAVMVSGEPRFACALPVGQVGARDVTTLEGLRETPLWDAIEHAFSAENAAQCGYCIPGILIATAALLAWNREPSDADVRRALAPHLCRCGAHAHILRAVRRSARELALLESQASEPTSANHSDARESAVARKDARAAENA